MSHCRCSSPRFVLEKHRGIRVAAPHCADEPWVLRQPRLLAALGDTCSVSIPPHDGTMSNKHRTFDKVMIILRFSGDIYTKATGYSSQRTDEPALLPEITNGSKAFRETIPN